MDFNTLKSKYYLLCALYVKSRLYVRSRLRFSPVGKEGGGSAAAARKAAVFVRSAPRVTQSKDCHPHRTQSFNPVYERVQGRSLKLAGSSLL